MLAGCASSTTVKVSVVPASLTVVVPSVSVTVKPARTDDRSGKVVSPVVVLVTATMAAPLASLIVSFTVPTLPSAPVLLKRAETTTTAELPSKVTAPPYVLVNQSPGISTSQA